MNSVVWMRPDGSMEVIPEPPPVKLQPPAPKRIRPTTPLKPLAAKLLAIGMGWRR